MKTITISASDVAACIGKNPYKSRNEIITKLLSKYCKHKTVKTEEQQVEELIHDHPIMTSLVNDITITSGILSPQTVRENIKKQVGLLDHFTNDDKKKIEGYMYSKANTTHGIKLEDHTAHCISDQLVKDDTFYTHLIYTTPEYRFKIVGRIDRIENELDGTKTIIEIKNRVRGLFGKVKEYEEIQVQTYLQLVGLEKARLIEQDNTTGIINSYNIKRDNDWWSTIITDLRHFCEYYIQESMK